MIRLDETVLAYHNTVAAMLIPDRRHDYRTERDRMTHEGAGDGPSVEHARRHPQPDVGRSVSGADGNCPDDDGRNESSAHGDPRQFPWQNVACLSCTGRREVRERSAAIGKRKRQRR
jgi:hypothetical protein